MSIYEYLRAIVRVLGLTLLLALTGCPSKEEQQRRNDDAFILDGNYQVLGSNAESLSMELRLASKGHRSQLQIDVFRRGRLSEAEQTLLTSVGINPEVVASHFFGQWLNFSSQSENNNQSSDNGNSSYFWGCYQDDRMYPIQYEQMGRTFRQAQVQYCLNATAHRETERIEGQLELVVRGYTGESGSSVFTLHRHRLTFQTAMLQSFSAQFVGQWSGRVVMQDGFGAELGQLTGMELEEQREPGFFPAYPLFREVHLAGSRWVRVADLQVAGSTFRLMPQRAGLLPIDLNAQEDAPSVLVTFESEQGDRILFVGTIWSLSNFAGQVVLVQDSTEQVIGSFQFRKD